MKTIKQIADEIGVSRQAVYKKTKQEPLSTSLQPFMSTNGNIVYISVDGEKLIKSAFSKDKLTTVSTNTVDNLSTQFITSLQEQIQLLTDQNKGLLEQLNQERQHSREQADKITDLANKLAVLTDNAQKLHLGTIHPQHLLSEAPAEAPETPAPTPVEEPPAKRRGLLNWIGSWIG